MPLVGVRALGRRRIAAAVIAIAAITSACGRIDQVREVFDTTPAEGEEAASAATTTLPLIDLGTRFDAPPLRIEDDELVYTLDPKLVGNDATGSSGVDSADASTTTAALAEPGPLTHVQVRLTPAANVREIDGIRTALERYRTRGAALAELDSTDLRAAANALYDDDREFVRLLSGRRIGPVLLLSHRWPVESGQRTAVVRQVQDLPGVASVDSSDRARIHRTTLGIETGEEVVARLELAPTIDRGVAVLEGQRLVLFDDSGRRLVSVLVPRAFDPGRRLQLAPAGDRAVVTSTDVTGPATDAGCRVTDRRGLSEVRVCVYSEGTAGIEVRNANASWTPLVGVPPLPRRWDDDPPVGAQPPVGRWIDAQLAPDLTQVLAQWGGTCDTAGAALIDVVEPQINWIEGTTRRLWGPGAEASGWSSDGRAFIFLGPDRRCQHQPRDQGLQLLSVGVEDDGDLELLLRHGGAARVRTVPWSASAS